jgi:long-chain acyl-CoA synthetase
LYFEAFDITHFKTNFKVMEHSSLPQLFEASVKKFPDNVLLWEKKTTEYRGTTYKEAHERVMRLAAGFLTLGLQKGDRVALVSEGRNDWVVGELALLFCNAASVPLSVKLEEPGDLIFRITHSGCKGVIVSGNHKHKIFNIIDQLPTLEFILLLDAPEVEITDPDLKKKVVVIDDLIEKGADYLKNNRENVEAIKNSVGPNDYANICYTSGTTADPKGIILTHLNYLCNVEQGSAIFDVPSYYTSLHILPWDHSFAHTVGIYALIRNGASLASLKVGKTANETLRNIPICINEVKPYFMLSVPALAKNFRKNIEKGVKDKGKIAWALFSAGISMGYAYNQEGFNKGKGWRVIIKPFYKLIDTILFKKIRGNFGGRLRFFVGGGALLDIELQRFFYAIGMPMYQGYGLTEAAPVISSNTPDFHKLGSSGKVVPWLDLKICNEDGRELPIGEQGEIVIRGDNVMAGYWANENATKETIRDGWLYTGDLGYLDNDGYLYVLGRSKSLLIGGDGEKYSPEGIEEAMVEQIQFFDQVMLFNNQNPYTVALVVINKAKLKDFLQKNKLTADTESGQTAALIKLRAEIDRFMPGGDFGGMFPARWLPAAVAFLDEPFSEQNKLMNSTMKIVRPAIVKYHRETLDFLYTPEGKELQNQKNRDVIARLG